MKTVVNSIDDIRAVLAAHKEEVVRRYRVTEIGIFGSFVRGEQKKRSDVDILVEFAPRHIPGFLKLMEMERFLGKILKRKVEVVIKSGIRPELKEGILKEVVYI